MEKLCNGRVAIVTGAGRGLGREYALRLAAHGARVVVNDLGGTRDGSGSDPGPAQQVVDEIRAVGGEAVANHDDVSNWAAAKHMIEQAVETFGRLDVLINNAGILRDRMIVNMTEQEWDSVIQVHLKGTIAPMHHAAAHWRALNKSTGEPVGARIINTSSASGIYCNPGQSNYGAAKAAIASLTGIGARELSRYGVTVNAIAPAALTRLTESLREITPELKEFRHARWVASVAVWLASVDSAPVNGRVIEAGGGVLAVAEGWHRGPTVDQMDDPVKLGPVLLGMVREARLNAGVTGQDQD